MTVFGRKQTGAPRAVQPVSGSPGQTARTETIKSQIGKRGEHTWTVVLRV